MKPTIPTIVTILAVVCLLLPACKSKRDQCASIIGLLRTEARATDNMAKKKADAKSAQEYAELLVETAAELRGMDIQDQRLKFAIASYNGALGALTDPKTSPADRTAILTYLESSRRRVADNCNR
jgi:hypothetical protein